MHAEVPSTARLCTDVVGTSAAEFSNPEWDLELEILEQSGSFRKFADHMAVLGSPMSAFASSAARFRVVAARKASYYLLNYVMIVSLLTAVSWLSFFIDASALDARVGVSLTLLLAIGVFQLVSSDSLLSSRKIFAPLCCGAHRKCHHRY